MDHQLDSVDSSPALTGSAGSYERGTLNRPEDVSTTSTGSAGSNMGHTLELVRKWLSRFISVSDDRDLALLTLWAAHTYVCMETYSSPRLQIDSAMPGSGKTTVLEHLQRLAWHPVQAASISSPALLARMIDKGIRTILIDEVDRSLDPKKPGVEDLIAILNSGYKRGATRPVLVPASGGEWDIKEMPTFSPVAMAGNAPALPDDTRSRCIRLLLMPDLTGAIESSDWEEIEIDAHDLAENLRSVMDEARDEIRTVRPTLPDGCVGRIKEKWNPLRRVAEVAGGSWPAITDDLIRRDILEIEMEREDGLAKLPPAVVLLRDIYEVWTDETFMPSSFLASLLAGHRPEMWGQASAFGKDLTTQRMGRMLVQAFKIHSDRNAEKKRGYPRSVFEQAWKRMQIMPQDGSGTVPPNRTGPTGLTGPTVPTNCRSCGQQLHPSHYRDGIHPTCTEPILEGL